AIAFWLILFVSTDMAAAIVLGDDGWRVLHVTNVLIACFLALGFATPSMAAERPDPAPSSSWQMGAIVIAGAAALFVAVPAVSTALTTREIARHPPIGNEPQGEHIVPGGRLISGFVVVPDGTERPLTVPSLPASDFIKMVRQVRLEDDIGPFVDSIVGRLP